MKRTGVGVHRRFNHVFENCQKEITKWKPCKFHVIYERKSYRDYLRNSKIEEKKSLLVENAKKCEIYGNVPENPIWRP